MVHFIEQDEGWSGFSIGCVLMVAGYAFAGVALWVLQAMPK